MSKVIDGHLIEYRPARATLPLILINYRPRARCEGLPVR
jgi:hypothetical protein